MTELLALFDASFLAAVPRFTAPILLAALGGLLCERAGVWNVALEGLVLAGAFGAVVASFAAGSGLVGALGAMAASLFLAGLMGAVSLYGRGHVIVVGIAVNLLAAGATAFLLRALFDVKGVFDDPRIVGLGTFDIPLLGKVPGIGPLLSGQAWTVWVALLGVPAAWVFLERHPYGLRLRGVGEHAAAAETLGVDARRIQLGALLASGALCGLAGAQLAIGNVTLFVDGMSAGRGWIAVVAVLVGRARPFAVLLACTVFGVTDAFGVRLQGFDVPSQVTETLPYLVTLIGLVWIGRRRQRALDVVQTAG